MINPLTRQKKKRNLFSGVGSIFNHPVVSLVDNATTSECIRARYIVGICHRQNIEITMENLDIVHRVINDRG